MKQFSIDQGNTNRTLTTIVENGNTDRLYNDKFAASTPSHHLRAATLQAISSVRSGSKEEKTSPTAGTAEATHELSPRSDNNY